MPLSASAAIRVGQLFVRGEELSAVADRVARHLESQGDGATEGRASRELLLITARPGKGGGWHLLLDSTSTGVDPTLARALAASAEGQKTLEVLRVEVEGDRLFWRRAASRKGALPDPEPNFQPEQPPSYEDAELAAWRWLAGRKVESGMRLVGLAAFEATGEGEAGGREAIALEVKGGARIGRLALRVRMPAARKAPPTPVDATLPEGMGEPGQTIDLIKLTGEVERARLGKLATVLLAIQRRHRRGDTRPFCHLVEAPYLKPLYGILAGRKGPCQKIYRTLLKRAEEEKAKPAPGPKFLRPGALLPEAQGE